MCVPHSKNNKPIIDRTKEIDLDLERYRFLQVLLDSTFDGSVDTITVRIKLRRKSRIKVLQELHIVNIVLIYITIDATLIVTVTHVNVGTKCNESFDVVRTYRIFKQRNTFLSCYKNIFFLKK